ncbi:MAG TPA: hypothetical protein VKA02_14560 [Candidatus Acidoferrum sp.]|nr:hypothetical protein [Candidatus Acidoferrum sp.]
MSETLNLRNLEWALTTLTELILFVYLVRRKLFRSHPIFSAYILGAILQSVLMAATYGIWGTQSYRAWLTYWLSQLVMETARFAAVAEVVRRVLSPFAGIWALGRRVLIAAAGSVFVYAALLSREYYRKYPLNLDRGVGLAVAAVIVTLLLFARYYGLPMNHLDRSLCIGFCLYSCFAVINDSILEKWATGFMNLWSFLGVLTFLASLLLWLGAARAYSETAPAGVPVIVPKELYGRLSSELNVRLRLLNEHLNQLLNSGNPRS